MKREEIEKKATEILKDHGLLSAPVDPLKLAKILGIKVMNAVFSEEDKSGAVIKRGDNFSIYLNANDHPSRKRFTIAHELGHRLLHMNDESEFIDTTDNFRTVEFNKNKQWDKKRKQEWEANIFAAALLMNELLVREAWQEEKDPESLAWLFQVSISAMVIRLTQLNLVDQLP